MMLGNVEMHWFDDLHDDNDNTSYIINNGNPTSGTRNTNYSLLADIIFVTFTMLIIVVMLNLLVAILGNTYAKIAEHETVQMQYERAKCIYEIERHFLPRFVKTLPNLFPRFLHIVEPGTAHHTDETSETRIRRDLKTEIRAIRQEIDSVRDHVDMRVSRVMLLLEPGVRISRRDHNHPLRAVHFHLWSRCFPGGKWRCSSCSQDFDSNEKSLEEHHELCFVCQEHYPQSQTTWRPPLRCSFTLCSVCVRNEVAMPAQFLAYNDVSDVGSSSDSDGIVLESSSEGESDEISGDSNSDEGSGYDL